jgi:parallel beta-helix repeat protein
MSVRNHTHEGGVHRASLRWVFFLLVATLPGITAQAAPTSHQARVVSLSPANLVTVTTTADVADGDTSSFSNLNSQPGSDGVISLREALQAANTTPTSTLTLRINFDIPITDTGYYSATQAWTIPVGSVDGTALPPLERGDVRIDGSTQPGGANHPRIVLDGAEVQGLVNGLTITSGNNVVRGLALPNFLNDGLSISSAAATNNQIAGCYIGTDAQGLIVQGDGTGIGIELFDGAHDNLIGGSAPTDRNLISGTNYNGGIWIHDAATADNTVAGNWIGVDSSGQTALPNLWAGVFISDGAYNNLVGGAGQGNLISGNERGVYIYGGVANTLAGNTIGLAFDGKQPLGNTDGGIFIAASARDNVIGGTTPGARNIISGNGVSTSPYGQGIFLQGPNTTNNTIQGNYIGVDASGKAGVGNYHQGVLIDADAPGNTVGGTADGAGNVIAYNGQGGIWIDSSSNLVAGNLIGVGADRSPPLGNQQNGIRISTGSNNVIGPDNWIASNQLSGIMLSGSNTTVVSNTLTANARSGICVAGSGTQIRGNWISGNGGIAGSMLDCNIQGGVVITGTGNTEVISNTILDNQGAGVTVRTGVDNQVLSNSISGNSTLGIKLLDGGNHDITPPTIERASPSSVVGTSCPICRVEIFTDNQDQGRYFITATLALADGSFSVTLVPGTLDPPHVTATNTDPNGNTSPFAPPVDVTTDPTEPPLTNLIYLPIVRMR